MNLSDMTRRWENGDYLRTKVDRNWKEGGSLTEEVCLSACLLVDRSIDLPAAVVYVLLPLLALRCVADFFPPSLPPGLTTNQYIIIMHASCIQ